MTYICHDTAKNTAGIDVKGWTGRFADWIASRRLTSTGSYLDPRNEHLKRDIGVTVTSNPEVFRLGPPASRLPAAMTGAQIRFIDLFLSEHLDRGPR